MSEVTAPNALHPLFDHPPSEVSAFTAESLLAAVKSQRGLSHTRVPEVCVLEFDGDLSDKCRRKGLAQTHESWACFHTEMGIFQVDGRDCGMVARTIGGPYAVLVAEQLVASGAKIVLGLTSAGRIATTLPLPSLVVIDEAIRDEGTSLHYVPAGTTIHGDAALATELTSALASVSLPVHRGIAWTTDAPYRETRERIAVRANQGALAVEMQAASLFAFAQARGARVGMVAHVTNAVDAHEEPFHKGPEDEDLHILFAMCRAAFSSLSPTGSLT